MEKGHGIGKFNILRVNVILFQGNQKTGRNNAASGLFTKKSWAISRLSGRLKAQFLVTHGCLYFPKEPIVFEIYVEFGTFWYQICRGSKNFAFGLMAGKFGKFGLKALFVSCTFIVSVAEALDHESTNEDFRGCSHDDKHWGNQRVRPKYLKPWNFSISVS